MPPFNKTVYNPAKAPCKDCQNRQVGCHAGCAPYAEFRSRVDEFNRQRRIATKSYVDEFITKRR